MAADLQELRLMARLSNQAPHCMELERYSCFIIGLAYLQKAKWGLGDPHVSGLYISKNEYRLCLFVCSGSIKKQ